MGSVRLPVEPQRPFTSMAAWKRFFIPFKLQSLDKCHSLVPPPDAQCLCGGVARRGLMLEGSGLKPTEEEGKA